MTNAEARFKKSLRPRKPEDSLGRTAQDVHLDSHTAPNYVGIGLSLSLICQLTSEDIKQHRHDGRVFFVRGLQSGNTSSAVSWSVEASALLLFQWISNDGHYFVFVHACVAQFPDFFFDFFFSYFFFFHNDLLRTGLLERCITLFWNYAEYKVIFVLKHEVIRKTPGYLRTGFLCRFSASERAVILLLLFVCCNYSCWLYFRHILKFLYCYCCNLFLLLACFCISLRAYFYFLHVCVLCILYIFFLT